MFHHQPLTPAAPTQHVGRAPAARRLILFLLVFLTLAAGAPFAAAEMVYYTEDFIHDGVPGFDPMFNHEITERPDLPAEAYPTWNITQLPSLPETHILTLRYGALDRITLNVGADQPIEYAAVEIPSPYGPSIGDITFIGTNDTWKSSDSDIGKLVFEIRSSQIGTIQAIELRGAQLGCQRITFGTVPEPSECLLLVCGSLAWACLRMSRRRPC